MITICRIDPTMRHRDHHGVMLCRILLITCVGSTQPNQDLQALPDS